MKKHQISVSRHNLTRCSGCGRHHQIETSLSSQELLELECEFCGSKIIGGPSLTRASTSRTSKIAMGLLSASLAFSACDDDDEVVDNPPAGEMAGTEIVAAGDFSAEPMYGVFPAGEEAPAGAETAGVEVMPAGDDSAQPEYGVFPAGEEGPAGEEMPIAGDDSAQPMYGNFPVPAGEEVPAGESAGEETPAGESAGEETPAGESTAGVEMVPAGDDSPQPEYGVPPAGSEG